MDYLSQKTLGMSQDIWYHMMMEKKIQPDSRREIRTLKETDTQGKYNDYLESLKEDIRI